MNVIQLATEDRQPTGEWFRLAFPLDRPPLFRHLTQYNAQVVHVIAPALTEEVADLLKKLKRWRGVGIVLTTDQSETHPLISSWLSATAPEEDRQAAYLRAGLGELAELADVTEIGPDFYGEKYLYQGGHVWTGPDGNRWKAGYEGRSWDGGYGMILKGIRVMLPNGIGTVLDLGTDVGGWVDFLVRQGVDAYGVDYSPWAIEHPVGEAVGRIFLENLTKAQVPMAANLITAFDFWEHIYAEDISQCLANCRKPDGERVYLFQIPTWRAPNPCYAYMLTRGEKPDFKREDQWFNMAKGHVTMLSSDVWEGWFQEHGLTADPDAKARFVEGAAALFRACPNWLPENIHVYR